MTAALAIVPDSRLDNFTGVESIDAEETVIAFCLRSKAEETDSIFARLKPSDFGERPYRLAYEAMLKIRTEGVPIDVASLKINLELAGKLADVGGLPALKLWKGGGLMATEISQESAIATANQVVDRSRRRIAVRAGQELIKLAQDITIDTNELIKRAESIMLEMALGSSANDDGESIGDLALAALADVDLRRQAKLKQEVFGIPSCLIDLNNEIGGYGRGDLVVFAGRPGSGKSALAVNEGVSIAKMGLPVLMFSLEMKGVELATRILGSESRTDLTRMRDGIITGNDFQALENAALICQDLSFQVYAQPDTTIEGISSIARRAKAKATDGTLGAVIIDYAQLMQYDEDNENNELTRITKAAKKLAMELDCPVFLLSQLNRSCESRQDKRPMASDLRGSGAIEQAANLIIMVYRQAMYEPECQNKHEAELIINKHRSGRRGQTIKTFYDEKTTTFRNLA
jgi:replicative DNA helicase